MDIPEKSLPFILSPVFRLMNQLELEGFITRYVMGGSMALMPYSEPFLTDNVDFFCYSPQKGLLLDLGPIYKRVGELGYTTSGPYLIIEGVQIQFLAPDGPLLDEAMETAVELEIGEIPTRVFQLEYALSIKAQANRKKDWLHIMTVLDSAKVNRSKLEEILEKFGLLEQWRRHIDD